MRYVYRRMMDYFHSRAQLQQLCAIERLSRENTLLLAKIDFVRDSPHGNIIR